MNYQEAKNIRAANLQLLTSIANRLAVYKPSDAQFKVLLMQVKPEYEIIFFNSTGEQIALFDAELKQVLSLYREDVRNAMLQEIAEAKQTLYNIFK